MKNTNIINYTTKNIYRLLFLKHFCLGWVGIFLMVLASYHPAIAQVGSTCENPIVIPVLPYSANYFSSIFGNNYLDVGANCSAELLTGRDGLFMYTPSEDQYIKIELEEPSIANSAIFVFESCADIGAQCLASSINPAATTHGIYGLGLTGGNSYHILLSSTDNEDLIFQLRMDVDQNGSGDGSGDCENNLVLSGTPGNTENIVSAISTIRSSEIIPDGSNVTYEAGVRVCLDPGFTTGAGTEFYVRMDPCNGVNPNAFASIAGLVTNEDGFGLREVQVSIAGISSVYTTDLNGYFWINESVDTNGVFLQTHRDGYLSGSRFYIPGEEAGTGNIHIQLVSADPVAILPASSGGTVPLEDGASVEFSSNSVITESGEAYNGNINVAAKWISPDNNCWTVLMPGNLRALGENGEELSLASAGMTTVEITGDNGEALALADGATATLTGAITDDFLGSAPATIPMWYFDETDAYWKREGTAVKVGDTYVAQVSHFSTWNFDLPRGTIRLKFYLKDADNNPLGGIHGVAKCCGGLGSRSFITKGGTGYATGKIPRDEIITLNFKPELGCGNNFVTNVGPFSQSTTIHITVPPELTVKVCGRLVNCEGSPVSEGYVTLKTNDNDIDPPLSSIINSDGTFCEDLMLCSNGTALLHGYDSTKKNFSPKLDINIANGNVNVGDIEVCQVKDGSGNRYSIIEIGNQEWLSENLRTEKCNNMDSLVLEPDPVAWSNLTTGAYCWYNNDKNNYERPYGALYNWYVISECNVCPVGWRVPTSDEWNTLIAHLDSAGDPDSNNAAIALKSTNAAYWNSSSSSSAPTNTSGYSGVASGSRLEDGLFNGLGDNTCWWSPAASGSSADGYRLRYYSDEADKHSRSKKRGYSIRCIKGN